MNHVNQLRIYSGIIAFIALLLLGPPHATGQIGGTIDSDTTWSDSPVTVNDTVIVTEGATLTIDPSVEVRFQSNTGLIIEGGLIADGGSESTRIVFTSDAATPAPGDWNSIVFVNKSDVGSYVNHAVIEYGGGGGTQSNVFYETGAFGVPFSNSIIRHSAGHGMDLRASDPQLDSLSVRDNQEYGLFSDVFSNFTVTDSDIVNNGLGGIRIAVNAEPTISSNRIDSNDTGIFMDSDAKPTITENKVRHNNIGVHVIEVGSVQPNIRNNRILGNSQYGMLNETSTGSFVDAERNYWGDDSGPFHPSTNINGKGNEVSDYIDFDPWITETELSVTEITSDINQDTTWKQGVFWIKNSIDVNGSYTLTIEPGVVVKFAPDVRLDVHGTLLAEGTESSKIIFTSDKDDSHGGDTNGDGISSSPSEGDWDRINIRNGSSVIRHATIKYGASNWQGAIHIRMNNSDSLNVSNLFMTRGQRNAIRIDNGSAFHAESLYISEHYRALRNRDNNLTMTVTHSVLAKNDNHGIQSDGPIRKLTHSSLRDNGEDGVHNYNVSGDQLFENNTFKNNGRHGLFVKNQDSSITIRNNTFEGNGREGFYSSRARILNNTIRNNRFPFGIHGKIGNTYTDTQGKDGNVIDNNSVDNAIRIRETLQGTLSTNTPAHIDTSVYVAYNDITINNDLVIEPGAVLKFRGRGTQLEIDRKLTAVGTENDPIVFTSWRDTLYGGDTREPGDGNFASSRDWNHLRLRNGSSSDSRLKHIIIRYGDQNLSIRKSLAHPLDNIRSEFGRWGYRQVRNVVNTLTNSTIRKNNREGIELHRGELTVRNTTVEDNGNHGMFARGGNNAAFREVTNSTIQNNGNEGIRVNRATIPQTFKGNIVKGNDDHGIYNRNSQVKEGDVQFIGNVISNNDNDGVISSSARFIDNEIEGNRYPLAVTGQLGNRYEDSDGKDGNIIRNNTHNNLIRLTGAVRGTLNTVIPDSMDFKYYVTRSNINVRSNDSLSIDSSVVVNVRNNDFDIHNGATLDIDPGVIFKFRGRGARLDNEGKFTAVGTKNHPIIFTSWRDTLYGPDTRDPGDETPPSNRDWNIVRLQDETTSDSRLEHAIIRYGDQNIRIDKSLDHPIDSIRSENGHFGLEQRRNVLNTLTNSVIRGSNSHGIHLNDGELTVLNTTIEDNGNHGIRTRNRNNATLREIRNSTLRNNGNNGIYSPGTDEPISIVNNTIDSNNVDGIHVRNFNDQTDSLLVISGNEFRANRVGLISTRALITDNNFEGNNFPLGVTHQLSLEGSSTEDGNYYNNNSINNNRYNNAIWLTGTIYGKLGYTYPDSMENPVYARLDNRYTLPSGDSLDIAPGTVIKMRDNRFRINGKLIADGEADEHIVFTSWKDDSFGGDSNADSAETVPQSDDWRFMRFRDNSSSESYLNNVTVRYGRHNIRIRNNSSMIIDSTSSAHASNNGFFIRNGSPVIRNAEIHHNNKGVRVRNDAEPQIQLSNIYKNSSYGLHSSSSNTVTATDNYWGHESGPLVQDDRDPNLSGEGNEIRMDDGFVEYRPFLKDRSGILLGDVNSSGTISSYDAALILQYLVDKVSFDTNQKRSANVDGDTTVTAMDASYVLQFVVDLISAFPGQGKPMPDDRIAEALHFETASGDNWQDLKIHYNGDAIAHATELSLSVESQLVDSVKSMDATLTKNFTRAENREDGKYKLAMANSRGNKKAGTLLHLRLYVNDEMDKNGQELFTLNKFAFNQYNLTDHFDDVVTSMATDLTDIPDEFKLEHNYPNPFNPTTKIPYQVPKKSDVKIEIYDALGRHVATIVDKNKQAGYHTVQWDAVGQASGVYLYRISAKGSDGTEFQDLRKMTLVK